MLETDFLLHVLCLNIIVHLDLLHGTHLFTSHQNFPLTLVLSQLALNHPSVHLHAENSEDQHHLPTEYSGDQLQAEEGERQVQLNALTPG